MSNQPASRRLLIGLAAVFIIAIVVDARAFAATPTAKQALLAKVQPLAKALAAKKHWHITPDRKITTVSCSTFLGSTTCYGSVAVNFWNATTLEKTTTMAVGGWSAKLTRSHGRWIVTKVHRDNLTVIS